MLDLTFITSNRSKLANVSRICRDYDVNIISYKKRYYGVAYDEPRILENRAQLLDESFNDALNRWKKQKKGNMFFFIEDTSVRFEALSDETKDIPGIDIKYWMLEHDFQDTDRILREHGNNRRVTVFSHIMLYVPSNKRELLGMEPSQEYKVFESHYSGHIVEKEMPVETSLLYPWLDNKTFNKWFVPDGYSIPMSHLDISDADVCDFRKGAVEKMLGFVGVRKQLNNMEVDTSLWIPFYPSFVVCGATCAGKTTMGRFLTDYYGYYHIEASQFMTMKYWETVGNGKNEDKHQFAEGVLKENPLFVVKQTLAYIKRKNLINHVVITGFRLPKELEAFTAFVPIRDVSTVFINSNEDVRFERWKERHRDVEKYSQSRFDEINTIQDRMGVRNIADSDGIKCIDNNFLDYESFYTSIRDNLLSEVQSDELICPEISQYDIQELALEKCILCALYYEYRDDESAFFSTTEISRLINKKYFIHLKHKKNKNNVSRYFNQSYYPYYEIRHDQEFNRYQISPIGYSEAITILRNISKEFGA